MHPVIHIFEDSICGYMFKNLTFINKVISTSWSFEKARIAFMKMIKYTLLNKPITYFNLYHFHENGKCQASKTHMPYLLLPNIEKMIQNKTM